MTYTQLFNSFVPPNSMCKFILSKINFQHLLNSTLPRPCQRSNSGHSALAVEVQLTEPVFPCPIVQLVTVCDSFSTKLIDDSHS